MKPFYKSKKFWTALCTAAAAIVSYYYDPKLAQLLTLVGGTLIAGFGLADLGKEAKALK